MAMNTLGDEYGTDEYAWWWIWWWWIRLVMNMAMQRSEARTGRRDFGLIFAYLLSWLPSSGTISYRMYLFELQSVFVWIARFICLNCKRHLFELLHVFVGMWVWSDPRFLALVTSFMEDNIVPLHRIALHSFVRKPFCHVDIVIYHQRCHPYINAVFNIAPNPNFWSCILFVVHLSSLREVHYLATPVYTPVYPSILFGYLSVLFGYPSLLFGYPSIPQYTLVYPSVPHYTQVYPSIPQYTPIYTSSPQYTPVYPHLIFVTTITTQPL